MEVFIFLSRPDTSNSRVDFSTDGSSRPDRTVTIRRDICSFPGSSTSGSRAYFLFKLHDPTSGESGRQQQLTTRLSSCILDMCEFLQRTRLSVEVNYRMAAVIYLFGFISYGVNRIYGGKRLSAAFVCSK